MNRIFLDMDGVLADFDRLARKLVPDQIKDTPGAFAQMQPVDGAIAGVRSLIGMGYDVWVATKPATGRAHTYADKATWVFTHLPELKRKIVMTHDKGLLGDGGDFLVDDRPHKANCREFPGVLVAFGPTEFTCAGRVAYAPNWAALLAYFRGRRNKQLQLTRLGLTDDVDTRWPMGPLTEEDLY